MNKKTQCIEAILKELKAILKPKSHNYKHETIKCRADINLKLAWIAPCSHWSHCQQWQSQMNVMGKGVPRGVEGVLQRRPFALCPLGTWHQLEVHRARAPLRSEAHKKNGVREDDSFGIPVTSHLQTSKGTQIFGSVYEWVQNDSYELILDEKVW